MKYTPVRCCRIHIIHMCGVFYNAYTTQSLSLVLYGLLMAFTQTALLPLAWFAVFCAMCTSVCNPYIQTQHAWMSGCDRHDVT